MIKNTKKDSISKEGIQNIIGSFLGKNIELNNESKEKIINLINSLSEEDIKRITDMTKNGQLQNLIRKDEKKR